MKTNDKMCKLLDLPIGFVPQEPSSTAVVPANIEASLAAGTTYSQMERLSFFHLFTQVLASP
jgi:hypothetical protein